MQPQEIEQIQTALASNQAFSGETLALQLAWDSTSLGELKFCPRRYYYSIVLGWQSRRKNVDLAFGILVHSGVELYHKLRAQAIEHDDALRKVVKAVQVWTWDKERQRPQVWEDPQKNRLSLLRLMVWYLDRWKDDPIQLEHYPDGRPMVEVNFHFATSYQSRNGEQFLLCGYFDRLGKLQGVRYVPDIKTTRHTLDAKYFAGFSPDNQFSLYTLASKSIFDEPAKGIILDAVQVGAGFCRFQREFIGRTQEQIDEWYEDLGWWLAKAEEYAEALYWPMNDRMCWSCHFQQVCARPASARRAWLEANFQQRVWDPTQERKDI